MSTKRLHLGVAGLAALTLAGTAVVGSNAALTSSTDPGASSSAGTLRLDTDKEGSAIVDLSGIRPGSVRRGLVSVTNNGSRGASDARFVARFLSGSLELHVALTVELEECSSAAPACPGAASVLPPTSIDLLDTQPAALAPLGPASTRHYRVTVRWPADQDHPDLQGQEVEVSFDFEGVAGS